MISWHEYISANADWRAVAAGAVLRPPEPSPSLLPPAPSIRAPAGSMKRPDKICVSLPSFLCHFRRRLISTRSSMQRRPRTYWNWQLLLELQDFKNSHRIKCSFSLEFQKYIHSIYNINKDNKFQPNQNLPCFLNFSLFANSFIFNM